MGTPLPSYASSPHISRSSSRMSMRSLMISLATPSDVESLHTENRDYGFFDRPLHGGSHDHYHNFGYKLGRRLDTLAAGEHCEQCNAIGNEGCCQPPPRGEVLCIHPMRSGVPIKLPLPTLAGHASEESDQRGRNRNVKSATSSLRYQVDAVINEEQEKHVAEAEDCTAKLLGMVDKQLRRTYDRLKDLADELEGYGPIAPTPSTEETLEKASVVQPIGVTVMVPTHSSAISSTSTQQSPSLQQLVIERAAADPQHLRHLAELNLRLLRNLQDSMRRMDKLATVMKEHNAGMIKVDGNEDDGDDEVFVVQEREEVREKRRNSGSLEATAGAEGVGKTTSMHCEDKTPELVEARKGAIVSLLCYPSED